MIEADGRDVMPRSQRLLYAEDPAEERMSFVDRNVLFAGVDALRLTFLEREATRRGRRRSANA